MSVAEKLLNIMADVTALSKDRQVQGGGNYQYLSEEKITTVLHESFVKHRLAIMPVRMDVISTREITTKSGAVLFDMCIQATYRLQDPDDGDVVEIQALGEGSDSGDKVLNKCMTGAYKYVLRQACMISTGDDPDHVASDQTHKQASSQPRPAQPQGEVRGATPNQRTQITELASRKFIKNSDKGRFYFEKLHRNVKSFDEVSQSEAQMLITELRKLPDVQQAAA